MPHADAGSVREVRQDGVGGLGADHRRQLLAGGAADAGDAAEPLEQRVAAARADAGDGVQRRAQIAAGPGLAVIRDGEAVRLVADPLQQPQRRAARREGDGVGASRA